MENPNFESSYNGYGYNYNNTDSEKDDLDSEYYSQAADELADNVYGQAEQELVDENEKLEDAWNQGETYANAWDKKEAIQELRDLLTETIDELDAVKEKFLAESNHLEKLLAEGKAKVVAPSSETLSSTEMQNVPSTETISSEKLSEAPEADKRFPGKGGVTYATSKEAIDSFKKKD